MPLTPARARVQAANNHGDKAMANDASIGGGRGGSRWRIAVWGVAAFILPLPLLAMRFTDEVSWDETDFIVFGAMLAAACGIFELAARITGSRLYRAAVGVVVAASFLLIWINLAVGIIGTEDNPANLMFGGVLAVGIIGAVIARLRPPGMARALVATALAQALVGAAALATRSGSTGPGWPGDILGLTGIFTALWLLSAWLFRKAACEQAPAGAAP